MDNLEKTTKYIETRVYSKLAVWQTIYVITFITNVVAGFILGFKDIEHLNNTYYVKNPQYDMNLFIINITTIVLMIFVGFYNMRLKHKINTLTQEIIFYTTSTGLYIDLDERIAFNTFVTNAENIIMTGNKKA